NAAGGVVWATVVGSLGYIFGRQLPLIETLVRQFGVVLLVGLILALAVRYALKRWPILTWLRSAPTWDAGTRVLSAAPLAGAWRKATSLLRSVPRRRMAWLVGAALALAACGAAGMLALDIL
ncbi:MAG TPA: hypothetical protein VMV29_18095, partial [Ktedonobacterales bacterium]|nr:hypothetical protein [Ktedonobacterales bacterium]